VSTTRVLVVDDEPALADIVRSYLAAEGMDVTVALDGLTALSEVRDRRPDVVVLDVMLPGLDGFEVLRQLRAFSDAYVIMLTARAEEIDRIVGLSVGADDYLVKPFSPRELVARVKALLRRPRAQRPEVGRLELGELVIDRPTYTVTLHGEQLALTAIEFNLLSTLADERGVVFTRQQLLDRVWGMDFVGDEHVVDVHLGNLRRKLGDDPARPKFIETLRGIGYRFRADGG
jgi:Response regulators consisting of a CheY-like receiver domain and a winged-helix DNA-binding domain